MEVELADGVAFLASRPEESLGGIVLAELIRLAVLAGVGLLIVPRMLNEARNLARLYITTVVPRALLAA